MIRIFGVTTLLFFLFTAWLIFFWSPLEYSMGFVQKIMYIHVPSAWTGSFAFTVSFVYSILYLWKRKEIFDIIASCSVEIGTIFCGFVLITGSVWAKPTWNTYWTWDARLTTALILFLIFCGYILLRRFSEYGEQQARLSAVVAIIGFLDVPLIHFSVKWWRTLHQPSTVFSPRDSVIDTPLFITLLVSVVAFLVLYAFLLLNRIKLENKNREYARKMALIT